MKQLALPFISFIACLVFYTNCSNSGFQTLENSPALSSLSSATPSNVLDVSVGCVRANEPCVSVTVCAPNTNTCIKLPKILLSTQTVGLRIGVPLPGLTLPNVLDAGDTASSGLAECFIRLDGNREWGPLKKADVLMGGERASSLNIQMMRAQDPSFPVPSQCAQSSDLTGYQGILGIGPSPFDCGAACNPTASSPTLNHLYFKCTAGNCQNTAVNESVQVENPVAALDVDNVGYILSFPDIAAEGTRHLMGSLTFGINTQPNNLLKGNVRLFQYNAGSTLQALLQNANLLAMLEIASPTNQFSAHDPDLQLCASSPYYCPATQESRKLSLEGYGVSSMDILTANGEQIIQAPLDSFKNISSPLLPRSPLAANLVLGMPFFVGKTIYFGLQKLGTSAQLETKPYIGLKGL